MLYFNLFSYVDFKLVFLRVSSGKLFEGGIYEIIKTLIRKQLELMSGNNFREVENQLIRIGEVDHLVRVTEINWDCECLFFRVEAELPGIGEFQLNALDDPDEDC